MTREQFIGMADLAFQMLGANHSEDVVQQLMWARFAALFMQIIASDCPADHVCNFQLKAIALLLAQDLNSQITARMERKDAAASDFADSVLATAGIAKPRESAT